MAGFKEGFKNGFKSLLNKSENDLSLKIEKASKTIGDLQKIITHYDGIILSAKNSLNDCQKRAINAKKLGYTQSAINFMKLKKSRENSINNLLIYQLKIIELKSAIENKIYQIPVARAFTLFTNCMKDLSNSNQLTNVVEQLSSDMDKLSKTNDDTEVLFEEMFKASSALTNVVSDNNVEFKDEDYEKELESLMKTSKLGEENESNKEEEEVIQNDMNNKKEIKQQSTTDINDILKNLPNIPNNTPKNNNNNNNSNVQLLNKQQSIIKNNNKKPIFEEDL